MTLILASTSPRRLELLARIGVVPDRLAAPDIDESPLKAELPRDYVARLAAAKAAAVARGADEVVLAGDTAVAVGRRILEKPADEADLRRMLALLSGRRHHVYSGVCVIAANGAARSRVVDTIVAFKPLSAAEIDGYVACGEGMGKAGGYAIQGRAEAFVRYLAGSHSNVVGLPLFETRALLAWRPGSRLAEWLYEAGIGEARAALIADGAIVAARIERPGGCRAGAVLEGRLIERTVGLSRIATAAGDVLVDRLGGGVAEGGTLRVEIVREALAEAGRFKLAKGVATDVAPRDGDDLLARITASGLPVRQLAAHQPDALEAAGWSEVMEEARTGHIAFVGGALAMTPTPAMTLFDVDGSGPLDRLAVAAAMAVGQAIHRHGIGGSIGVDFPTLGGKAERLAAAAALDAAMAGALWGAGPFERTAVNGFGFLQLVRRRRRASLPELVRADPAGTQALAWLRTVERIPPPVPATHAVSPSTAAWLAVRPDLVAELSRRVGVPISLL